MSEEDVVDKFIKKMGIIRFFILFILSPFLIYVHLWFSALERILKNMEK